MIPPPRARLAWVAAALVVALLGWRLWPAQPPAPSMPTRVAAQPFAFVRSLEGTSPDAAVHADAGDQLVVDAALARLFDYYLSAQGERSLPAIRSEIEAELGRRLRPHAAQQARDLLGRYLDYKRALVDVEIGLQKGATAAALAAQARLVAMQQLRSQFFSPTESAGLFGFEDAYNADAIARMAISQDTRLDTRQKVDQLAALDKAMSPQLRAAREAPLTVVHLEERVVALRAQGGSEDDVYRLRASALDAQAAARLADLDREESAWKQRIQTYLGERRAILADSTVDGATRESLLQGLRERHFNHDEQGRLAAYEQ